MEKKVTYLRIGLGFCNIGVSDQTAEKIIRVYEKCLEVGDDFTIKDAVEIDVEIDRKYKQKELEGAKKD